MLLQVFSFIFFALFYFVNMMFVHIQRGHER